MNCEHKFIELAKKDADKIEMFLKTNYASRWMWILGPIWLALTIVAAMDHSWWSVLFLGLGCISVVMARLAWSDGILAIRLARVCINELEYRKKCEEVAIREQA